MSCSAARHYLVSPNFRSYIGSRVVSRMYALLYVLLWLNTRLVYGDILEESLSAKGLLGSHFGRVGLSSAFDYVVIGGGTAGLTVGRRLAANASVAIIEAGDFYEFGNGNLSEIPAYASFFTGNDPTEKNPHLDWYQYTEPQPVCRASCYLDIRNILRFEKLISRARR